MNIQRESNIEVKKKPSENIIVSNIVQEEKSQHENSQTSQKKQKQHEEEKEEEKKLQLRPSQKFISAENFYNSYHQSYFQIEDRLDLMNQTQYRYQMSLIQGLRDQVRYNTLLNSWYQQLIQRLTIANLKKKITQKCIDLIFIILLVIAMMCILFICCKVYNVQKLEIILCSVLFATVAIIIMVCCFYRFRFKSKSQQSNCFKKYGKIYKTKNNENDNNDKYKVLSKLKIEVGTLQSK